MTAKITAHGCTIGKVSYIRTDEHRNIVAELTAQRDELVAVVHGLLFWCGPEIAKPNSAGRKLYDQTCIALNKSEKD